MIVCIYTQISDPSEFHLDFEPKFPVLLVKLPCAIALHLYLHPEVRKGLDIMKFSNNQAELFHSYGSHISFVLGFLQIFISLFAQIINIILLLH